MLRKIIGTITSDKQAKTIAVTVTKRQTHPLYGKQYTRSRKFMAHDENNQAKEGDVVEIVETRPISRTKSFKLHRVIETGHSAIELKEEDALKAAPKPTDKKATP